ncbi:rhomboid family intramembrane serine protease [Halomicroarcula sp. GCM10025817]|jgi:membrane associated rhomboid family serine protease|uniref:rhomboid family intramembrane serine protease n=1 Tax=Haloarcula TaxID=2237 RepID=UPI0023E8E49E|nr:rhomboid family intramembrane serine protease [Halomicroarcula sp. SYNS111]
MRRRLADSPTAVTLSVLVAVFACQQVLGLFVPQRALLALSLPLLVRPWTLVTSVYAHTGFSHLLANALLLALVGLLVERQTTSGRYHLFFLGTGMLAGVAQVTAAAVLGPVVPGLAANVSVLGASGAIFAFFGYVLASNRVTDMVVAGLELAPRTQLALAGLLAVAITLGTATPGVALVAHFTGLLLGVLSGRRHLLRPA